MDEKVVNNISDDGDSSMNVSDPNPDNSVNYQTADEDNSRYFSVIEDESTIEDVTNKDLSLLESEQSTLTIKCDDKTTESLSLTGVENDISDNAASAVRSEDKSIDDSDVLTVQSVEKIQIDSIVDVVESKGNLEEVQCKSAESENVDVFEDESSKNVQSDSNGLIDKFNVHENVDDSTTVASGDADIFDDNESSVDGNDLVIDDDPQPSIKSDDCQESADAHYKYDEETSRENGVVAVKDANFSMLKKNHFASELLDAVENNASQGTEDGCKLDVKDLFGDSDENGSKSDSYNFPEGSHRVTLQMDGKDIEAINIGQDIYIYMNNDGALTAFQVLKEDGNSKIKFLHVGKNEDGNIELYEEQVNQVPVTNEDSVEVIEKSKSYIGDSTITADHPKVVETEKNSHRVIQAISNQGKKSPLIDNNSNASPIKISDLVSDFNRKRIEDESEVSKVEIKLDDNSATEKLLGNLHNGDILKPSDDIQKIDDLQKELVSIMDCDGDDVVKEDKITLYASQDSGESAVVQLQTINEVVADPAPEQTSDKIVPQAVDSDDDESSIIEGEPVTGDCELEWIIKDADRTSDNLVVDEDRSEAKDLSKVEENKSVKDQNEKVDSRSDSEHQNDIESVVVVEEETTSIDIDSFEPVVNRNACNLKTYSKESKLKSKPSNQNVSNNYTKTDANVESDSLGNNLAKDTSPSLKNRQPRKQVFTQVAPSDIEIIFLNNKTIKSCETTEETIVPQKRKEELSSSDRRKRGRPKRIVSEIPPTETEVEDEKTAIVLSTPEDDSVSTDDSKSSNNKENDSALLGKVEDKQTAENVVVKTDERVVPSTSGKRKKGRPKKILSASFCGAIEDSKVEESRKSLPIVLNDASSNSARPKTEDGENSCPLCYKNFRSKNVLFKHAKHCCGTIELVKSPKRKRVTADDEEAPPVQVQTSSTVDEDSPKTESSEELPTNKVEREEKIDDCEELSMTNEKVEDVEKSQEFVDKIDRERSEEVQCKEETKEKVEKIQEPLSDEGKVREDNIRTNLIKEHIEKLEKKIPALKRFKTEPKSGVPASPLTRLSKIMKVKPPPSQIFKCEICSKVFRQLAHKVNHQRTHDKEKPVKKEEAAVKEDKEAESGSILKCEVCQKGFRKLHHLVAHREVHEVKARRVSSGARSNESEAGFRCEICSKSFRKMHHLVEHRQMHVAEAANEAETKPPAVSEEDATCNGCGKSFRKRHHMVEHRDVHCSPSKIKKESADSNLRLSITSVNSDDSNNCGICGKSYRKLHHMVEHRESHADSSAKGADKSALDRLSSKDIIHECSKCYMVFPNVNSLNKHTTKCFSRKLPRKSAANAEARDESVPLAPKRKSVDSTTRESTVKRSVNKEVKSTINLRKSIAKVSVAENVTKIPPAVSTAKRPKLDTKEDEADKPRKESDDDDEDNVRYSLNPDYESSEAADDASKRRESESNTSEEETVRYSFPSKDSPKPKKVEEPVKKSVGRPRKSMIPTAMTPKKNTVTLLVKRTSLGGRLSLEGKKLPAPKKLQLRCCGKVFVTQASLAIHRKSHKAVRKVHKCDCGKQFENEILLKRHMDAEHTPPKSFRCQKCDVSLRTAAQYVKHKKSHDESAAGASSTASRKSVRGISEAVVPTPATIRKKRKTAHGGVPLSEKMKKALANAKF